MAANVITDPRGIAHRREDSNDKFLKAKLEPEHKSEYSALNSETGEYEIHAGEVAAGVTADWDVGD